MPSKIVENQLSCKYNVLKGEKEAAFMEADVTQALKDAENALRDFISSILNKKLGADWIDKCGVSAERIEKWRNRKAEEEKRQKFGVVEERLLYYADFYDLKTILKKHWDKIFAEVFGDRKTMEVWLDELGRLRDPDAHRRELLPHQKHLAVGLAGEIRTRLVRYRSKQETADDYFPRIESIRDSYGNIWTPGRGDAIFTNIVLRQGDTIDFVITASDPMGDDLEYGILKLSHGETIIWRKENSFSIGISKENIGKNFNIRICIRSPRDYHAGHDYDDFVTFVYDVLPTNKSPK